MIGLALRRLERRLVADLAGAAVDFVEIAIEESPNNEQTFASAVTPNRKSTNLGYPPARSARLSISPTPMSRADELRGIAAEVPRLRDVFDPAGSLSMRAYGDVLPYLLALAGFDYVITPGGALVTDPNSTTVVGVNALNSAVINVTDATPFEAAGVVIIAGAAVTYTGKTATTLTGCGAHAATAGGEAVNGNVPVGATKYVFTKRRGTAIARSARFRTNYAAENILLEGYGFGLSSLGINAAAELTSDLVGLYMRRLVADTVTVPGIPAAAIQPFRRGDLYVKGLANGGVLSDFSIAIANSLERIRTMSLSPPSDFPDALELGDEQVQVSGTIPKRVLDQDDYDALINATTFALTARWMGRSLVAATAKPYWLWVECPSAQYVGGDADELTNARRRGMDLSWFAAYDATAGYDVKITLVNNVAALETYV